MDTSNKDAWISEKIKKILAEGINGQSVDEKQAVAVAERMWEEMQRAHMARMPILPASPTKTVDGRSIDQKLIDAVLAYDKSKRPAILKLNQTDAHEADNSGVLALFDRVYKEGDWIYADFTPTNGNGEILRNLAAQNGPYPFRSIEVDKIEIDGKPQLWLESVALVGAQKPAVQNLPPVEFSASGSKFTFTVSLIGDEKPMETIKQEPIDKVEMAKQIRSELEAEFAKKLSDKEASLREEFGTQLKTEREERERLQLNLEKQEVERYFETELLNKVPTEERSKRIETAMKMSKEIRAEYLESLAARPAIAPNLIPVAGGLPNMNSSAKGDPEAYKLSLIRKVGEEMKLDVKTLDGYEKAMNEARKREPQAFALRRDA